MTDVTIYKPATVTIKKVGGEFRIVMPAGSTFTIQAINGTPPSNATLQKKIDDARAANLTVLDALE